MSQYRTHTGQSAVELSERVKIPLALSVRVTVSWETSLLLLSLICEAITQLAKSEGTSPSDLTEILRENVAPRLCEICMILSEEFKRRELKTQLFVGRMKANYCYSYSGLSYRQRKARNEAG